MVEVLTGIKGEPGNKSLSRIVAVECYPEDGCKTLQLGSHDLLNPFIDGFNEKGLFVTMLVDLQGVNTPMIPSGVVGTPGCLSSSSPRCYSTSVPPWKEPNLKYYNKGSISHFVANTS